MKSEYRSKGLKGDYKSLLFILPVSTPKKSHQLFKALTHRRSALWRFRAVWGPSFFGVSRTISTSLPFTAVFSEDVCERNHSNWLSSLSQINAREEKCVRKAANDFVKRPHKKIVSCLNFLWSFIISHIHLTLAKSPFNRAQITFKTLSLVALMADCYSWDSAIVRI